MRTILLLAGAIAGLWLVLRRRRDEDRRVVVAWQDGSELELGQDSPEHARLVSIASDVVR